MALCITDMKWDDVGADKPHLETQTGDYEVRSTEEETMHIAETAALIQLEIPRKAELTALK